MKKILTSFRINIKAERIKVRRTGIYLLPILVGIGLPIISFVKQLARNFPLPEDMLPYNFIERFFSISLWNLSYFVLPALIIIVVSRVTNIDHRTGGWRLMETQPIEKVTIYFSKFFIVLSSIALTLVTILVFSVIFGLILSKYQDVPVAASLSIPVGIIIQLFIRYFCAALAIVAIQYSLSVIIKGMIWPMIVGFTGVVLVLAGWWNGWVPQSWNPFDNLSNIVNTISGSDMGNYILYTEKISLLYSFIFLFVGFIWYKYKRFGLAFLGEKIRGITVLLIVIAASALVFVLVKPNQKGLNDSTVLCGQIESEEEFERIVVLDKVIRDTMAVIQIDEGNFHHVFKDRLILDNYYMIYDNKTSAEIFLGDKDSLFVKLRFFNKKEEFKFGGTRFVENEMQKNERSYSFVEYLLRENRYLEDPDQFARFVVQWWERQSKRQINYKSVDNFIPKEDFFERDQMLLAARYMLYWEEYLKKRKALYPDVDTSDPPELAQIREFVANDKEELLSNDIYVYYLSNYLIKNDTSDIPRYTKSLKAISELGNSSFKDKLLFKSIISSIEDVSTSKERSSIVESFVNNIDNAYYKEKIYKNLKVIDNLSKGMPAPYFEAVSLEDEIVSLDDFSGKYLMIDVWATWCGPCWAQSPHFERHAIKYKDENIQFVSISIDAKKENWFLQAKSKSKTVKQYHIINEDGFSNLYNIKFIPRFILIDPEGNLVYSEMVFPSEKAFEILLRKELGLPEEI